MPLPYLLNPDNEGLSYWFITEQNITYKVYFLDHSFVFGDYPAITCPVYSFNVEVDSGDISGSIQDDRVGATIAAVVDLFFENVENVALYVCESLDGREMARKRKFDIWFFNYNDGTLLKEDSLAVVEGVDIYNSIIIHKHNPQLTQIILAFKELNENNFGK